jgi:hypothetical protein
LRWVESVESIRGFDGLRLQDVRELMSLEIVYSIVGVFRLRWVKFVVGVPVLSCVSGWISTLGLMRDRWYLCWVEVLIKCVIYVCSRWNVVLVGWMIGSIVVEYV